MEVKDTNYYNCTIKRGIIKTDSLGLFRYYYEITHNESGNNFHIYSSLPEAYRIARLLELEHRVYNLTAYLEN